MLLLLPICDHSLLYTIHILCLEVISSLTHIRVLLDLHRMRRSVQKPGGRNSSSNAECMGGSSAKVESDNIEWEVRPGGMLVQKRDPMAGSHPSFKPPPTAKIRVTYGTIHIQLSINLQTTFGELKKMLAVESGLQPQEQRLIFKGKERDNSDFLDITGVKDKSKIILIEDPSSRERKYIEMKKNAKIESACKAVSEVSTEVDKLANQVSAVEELINGGKRVQDTEIVVLIELLMRQLVKLDGITADGEAKIQRRLQVRRVQKHIETLDVLKVRNAIPKPLLDHPVPKSKWETFNPVSRISTSTTTTHWESFD